MTWHRCLGAWSDRCRVGRQGRCAEKGVVSLGCVREREDWEEVTRCSFRVGGLLGGGLFQSWKGC